MKRSSLFNRARLLGSALAAATVFAAALPLSAQTSPDPAHAAHVATGLMPTTPATGDPNLAGQIAELRAKVAQLETTLTAHPSPTAAASAMSAMPAPGAPPAMSMGMDKMKSPAAMPGMAAPAPAAPPMAGMSADTAPAAGMMGMMDKVMPMGAAAAPMPSAITPGGMGMMAMEKMEMAGMMGMAPMAGAAPDALPQSALPGFPGASHLYHLGATGFFLDHAQHIALTTEQQAALNKIKEQSALAKGTADRAIQQGEQELWTLTAADQPDADAIQTKISAIGKLTGDERLAFIRAVGDASKILTDDQRKSLTGFAPPAPAAAMPAAGMKGM